MPMKNKNKFWQLYVAAAIIIILIIAVTLWRSFFSSSKPVSSADEYSQAQLILTTVGLVGVVFSLLFATDQFSQSQRRPELSLVLSDSKEDSITIMVPKQGAQGQKIKFYIENKGTNVAIWFECVTDLSKLPVGAPVFKYPSWDTEDVHVTMNNLNFVFKSLGSSAAFISAPLDIGSIEFFSNSQFEYEHQYELPYQIFTDSQKPKDGKLFVKFEKTST